MATKNDICKGYMVEYLQAKKKRKGEILKIVCDVTKMHRKAAIRKFRILQMKDAAKQEGRGRKTYYTNDITVALKEVWEAGNEVCGELLHPMIVEYVTIFQRDRMWKHSDEITGKLFAMSEATVKRRVGKFMKVRHKKQGISSTKPSHIKHLVPIFIGPWKDKSPGFGQIDTVRHSNSASGDAVYTLNYTDAATLGVFPRAQWNKGQEATRNGMEYIKEHLPFPLHGVHPDTGSEFINKMVMGWCSEGKIELSRSRPGHSNDNMLVEERNGHCIRREVGYITLNCREAVLSLNEFYEVLMPYLFHFVAVRRMTGKEKLHSRYRRTYEKKAKTPYQRVLEHPYVSDVDKEKLQQKHKTLNPALLHKEMEKRIKNVYDIQKRFGDLEK